MKLTVKSCSTTKGCGKEAFIIKNTTDVPDETVQRAVDFCKGLLPTRRPTCILYLGKEREPFKIFIYNTPKQWRGRYCYTHLYVNLGRSNVYPIHYTSRFKTAPDVTINSKVELLIWLLAHEFFHHRQFLLNQKFSERDADLYAASRLNYYQQSQSQNTNNLIESGTNA